MLALNPFIWTQPIDDLSKIVGMDAFANEVALILKGQTNVALFGPRDTGKTTFTTQLAQELSKEHGDDAPPFSVVRVNLQRALSIPGAISCVREALVKHPDRMLQREARRALESMDKEFGFDIKVLQGNLKKSGLTDEQTAEALHHHLVALTKIAPHVVVIFDEFQRLLKCPGEPLAIIRSALMSEGSNHVSLLLTGSVRAAMKMMLEDSTSPFFGEAHPMQLPEIPTVDFEEYLEYQFEATGKPISQDAMRYLLNLTSAHPKRTQQVAWNAWQNNDRRSIIQVEDVTAAFDDVVSSSETSEFASIYQLLVDGSDADVNDLRALSMLADQGGTGLTGRTVPGIYGFKARSGPRVALKRLEAKGLVIQRGTEWQIVDPVFAEWLRRQSPFVEPSNAI